MLLGGRGLVSLLFLHESSDFRVLGGVLVVEQRVEGFAIDLGLGGCLVS